MTSIIRIQREYLLENKSKNKTKKVRPRVVGS